MLYTKSTYHILTALIIAFTLTACGGDNSTGPDHGKAPAAPNLKKAEPDLSFFSENSPQKAKSGTDAFTNAALRATTGVLFTSIGTIYSGYFTEADQENADFNDGAWNWSYSYNYQGVSAQYRRTAKELNDNSVEWGLYFSFDNGDTHIDNYELISGKVSSDGSQGNWTFNALDPDNNQEIPAIKSTWDYTDDSHGTLDIKVYEEGDLSTAINYSQDDNNYMISFTDQNSDEVPAVIKWNTSTKVGYYQDDSGKACWDETLHNAACSDISL